MVAIIVVVAIVALIAIYFISSYNSFVRLKNKIKEAFSAMDISMKKRHDLIPNVVSTVKGYAKHEQETLEKVIQARNSAINASGVEEKAANESALNSSLKSLFALSESYPELKANENFISLQNQLSKIEDEIASSRRYYNAVVNEYNNKCMMFPSNLIAGMFGFSAESLFELTDVTERENVKVEF